MYQRLDFTGITNTNRPKVDIRLGLFQGKVSFDVFVEFLNLRRREVLNDAA